jgi:release factor glutamine methyltransferase
MAASRTFQAYRQLVQSLCKVYELDEAVSIAAIAMEDAFGIPPKKITDNQPFSEENQEKMAVICRRLLEHEPVQYVLGKTLFLGLSLKVSPAVLIPRQETEELVAWVIETIKNERQPPILRILDVGTGSGCIPISIKKRLPELEVHTLDISPAALEVARDNAALNQTEIHFHQTDILKKQAWNSLPEFDLIVSNPPYITQKEKSLLAKNVVDFEPHLALFSGGNDAQRFVKKITEFAAQHLSHGGWIFFETNEFYAPKSKEILQKNDFTGVELRKDLNGKDRMLRARKS